MKTKTAISLGVVFGRGGKVLMIRRMLEEVGEGGVLRWAFPGGKPTGGESGADCVKREIREETGYAVRVIREITNREHPNFSRHITYYLCELEQEEPMYGPQEFYEVAVIRWVRPQDVAGLVTSNLDSEVSVLLAGRYVQEAETAKKVRPGSVVKVRMGEKEKTLTLVQDGTRLMDSQLSVASPVGRALLGAQEGDIVAYNVGNDLRSLAILEVR